MVQTFQLCYCWGYIKNMETTKTIRSRLGKTIIITVGATYVLSILVVGLLINIAEITLPVAQTIRFVIAGIIGFATWNILKKNEQSSNNKK